MGNRGLSEISAVGEFGEFGNAEVREIGGSWELRDIRVSGSPEPLEVPEFGKFGNFRKLSEFAVVGRRGIGERGSWNVWEDRVWEHGKFGESGKLGSLEIPGV